MFAILGLIVVFFIIWALRMPFAQKNEMSEIRQMLARLDERLNLMEDLLEEGHTAPKAAPEPSTPPEEEEEDEDKEETATPALSLPVGENPWLSAATAPVYARATTPEKTEEDKDSSPFERLFGGKAFVWMGGIALTLGGFYMVKYSIEAGLLSPAVRTFLSFLTGLAMVAGGVFIKNRPAIANSERIAPALSGAGIAVLYGCFIAATRLYDLIPPSLAFVGMALVTASAILLSLHQGMIVAVLGLVGGFLAPAMIGSTEPNAPLLFGYLYLLVGGLMALIFTRGWWKLALPTLGGAFIWAAFWIIGNALSFGDVLSLGLFLIAVSATTIAASRCFFERAVIPSPDYALAASINTAAWGGATLIMGALVYKGGFDFIEWALFGFLAAASVALAFLDQKRYGLAPWASMIITLGILSVWPYSAPENFALVLSLFGIFFVASAALAEPSSPEPKKWAALAGIASLAYFLLAYLKLRLNVDLITIPHFWSGLAFILSALSVAGAQRVFQNFKPAHPDRDPLLGIYAGTATAFLTLGLGHEVARDFFAITLAGEMLALAWINTRTPIPAFRKIIGALGCIFAVLLFNQALLVLQLFLSAVASSRDFVSQGIALVSQPLLKFGIPTAAFTFASVFLRREKDDRLVQTLEIAAATMGTFLAYILLKQAFHDEENYLRIFADFTERAVITNLFYAGGLITLLISQRQNRQSLTRFGMALFALAALRTLFFDFLFLNPLWSNQAVGEMPILNSLWLAYGAPGAWLYGWTRTQSENKERLLWAHRGIFALAFVLISLLVRQAFHGTYLDGFTSNAELYTYSLVWLLFGIALLFLGTLRHDRVIRAASMGVLLLVVGKVFLWDASALKGLWRVFSFFGLGLSLLALSWFYSRFVFKKQA